MPISTDQIDDMSQLFKALSDPTRIRIINILMDGERNVQQITEQVGMTQSAVSHQLGLMRAIHLVRSRRDGRQIFYSLDDQHVVDLFQRSLAHVRHLTEKETEHILE